MRVTKALRYLLGHNLLPYSVSAGRGSLTSNTGRRGDLMISVKLEVPTAVDSEQRRLLEELARHDAPEEDGTGKQKGLFDKIKDVFD